MINDGIIPQELTDVQTLEEIVDCLQENIPMPTQGECNNLAVFNILVKAASTNNSIEATCENFEDAPHQNTIFYHLKKFKNMSEMEAVINKALQSRVPENLEAKPQRLAIDLNLLPYYGEPSEEEKPYVYRSMAKKGTCSFYAYATAYVIKKNKRVTIALIAVRKKQPMLEIVRELLQRCEEMGITAKRLYLDRGFCSVAIIKWLKANNVAFEMPMVIRGKKLRQIVDAQRKSGKVKYTMSSGKDFVELELYIVCTYARGERGRHCVERLVYIVSRVGLAIESIVKDYRSRFGIETSYRMKNICLIKTTTKSPVLRLLFVGIAFLLVNLWVFVLWKYVSKPQKGTRVVDTEILKFQRFLDFLTQSVSYLYKPITSIPLDRY
jgi:hypothetical protein